MVGQGMEDFCPLRFCSSDAHNDFVVHFSFTSPPQARQTVFAQPLKQISFIFSMNLVKFSKNHFSLIFLSQSFPARIDLFPFERIFSVRTQKNHCLAMYLTCPINYFLAEALMGARFRSFGIRKQDSGIYFFLFNLSFSVRTERK